MNAHCIYLTFSHTRKDLPHMSLISRLPRLIALLLLVLFTTFIVIAIILSLLTHAHVWHGFLAMSPNILNPHH